MKVEEADVQELKEGLEMFEGHADEALVLKLSFGDHVLVPYGLFASLVNAANSSGVTVDNLTMENDDG
jgi:hypothetical protein